MEHQSRGHLMKKRSSERLGSLVSQTSGESRIPAVRPAERAPIFPEIVLDLRHGNRVDLNSRIRFPCETTFDDELRILIL